MPPSQLKKLKASLHERGILGHQASKKQRKNNRDKAFHDGQLQGAASFQALREQFNPFEVKPANHGKYDFASGQSRGKVSATLGVARPGRTKSLGEEKRRKTLLLERQSRGKVGGITDRRFGEAHSTLTPEEKALERFVREKERSSKKVSVFDLEGEDDENELTHQGRTLSFPLASNQDDFHEDVSEESLDMEANFEDDRPRKRQRISDSSGSDNGQKSPQLEERKDRPMSKNEVMKEVIKKSKLYKYERQQAKEEDDDLRAELDKGLPDLYSLIRGNSHSALKDTAPIHSTEGNDKMNPDRLALLNGKDRPSADKEYDQRLRQMTMDQRAKPTVRTLTEQERLQQEADKLRELEERRLKRMRGEQADSDSEISITSANTDVNPEQEDATFGLGRGLAGKQGDQPFDVEDEDQFVIEDDIVASEFSDETSSEEQLPTIPGGSPDENDDAEFIGDILSQGDVGREGLSNSNHGHATNHSGSLAYTYECPSNHAQLLEITKSIAIENLPIVIQRIRALYQPQLARENKAKLGKFSQLLVEHLAYLTDRSSPAPIAVLEALTRHIHSLAKSFPEEVGYAFRDALAKIEESRPLSLRRGDLVTLTAIGSIFPTSDHFHQIVTPAMLCMTRYLEQKVPETLSDLSSGLYVCGLCLQYQRLSKRYIPEVVNYTVNAISTLLPTKVRALSTIPRHKVAEHLQIQGGQQQVQAGESLNDLPKFWIMTMFELPEDQSNGLKKVLVRVIITLINSMADLWMGKSAFCEIFDQIHKALLPLCDESHKDRLHITTREEMQVCCKNLQVLLLQSLHTRQPLRLHNHRPQAIKTFIPKFEESYNPDKHYDYDRDRAELSKLKAEHKRERKGALRELRKDANFLARESLREKRERDAAYERKYKRLVAEIQGEEGREAKLYEKEKKLRKSKR